MIKWFPTILCVLVICVAPLTIYFKLNISSHSLMVTLCTPLFTCSRSWKHCWPSWRGSPPLPHHWVHPHWIPTWGHHKKSPIGRAKRCIAQDQCWSWALCHLHIALTSCANKSGHYQSITKPSHTQWWDQFGSCFCKNTIVSLRNSRWTMANCMMVHVFSLKYYRYAHMLKSLLGAVLIPQSTLALFSIVNNGGTSLVLRENANAEQQQTSCWMHYMKIMSDGTLQQLEEAQIASSAPYTVAGIQCCYRIIFYFLDIVFLANRRVFPQPRLISGAAISVITYF